jgi:hypothetical protein
LGRALPTGGGAEKKKPELQLGNAMQCSQSSKVVFVETRRSKKRQLKEMMNRAQNKKPKKKKKRRSKPTSESKEEVMLQNG